MQDLITNFKSIRNNYLFFLGAFDDMYPAEKYEIVRGYYAPAHVDHTLIDCPRCKYGTLGEDAKCIDCGYQSTQEYLRSKRRRKGK